MNRQSRRLIKSVRRRGGGRLDGRARNTVDIMMRTAAARQEEGDLDAALAGYDDVIELYPDHLDALSNSGFIIAHLGDTEGALPRLRKAIELAPDDAKPHNNLGTVLETAGLLDEAETHLRRAIEIDPTIAEAHVNLGNVLQKLDKPDDADAAYGEAFVHAAEHPATFVNLAVALMGRGHYETAKQSLQKALAIDPNHPETLFNRGLLHQHHGEFADSAECYRAAIAAKPGFANAYYGLGNVLDQAGDSEGAITAYRDCIKANPAHANACLGLSRLLREEGRINEMVPMLRSAAAANPVNPIILSLLANLLCDGDDLDEALSVGIKAHVVDDTSAPAICSLSKALVEKGLYEDAASVYDKLTAPANDHDVVAHGWLAESLLRHQRLEDGWFILDRLLDVSEITGRQRYGYLILKAIYCWLSDDPAGSEKHTDEAEKLLHRVGPHELEKNPLAYSRYIAMLIDNRRLKSELYRDSAPDTLHVIGESHCLSPHGTALDLGGDLYRLEGRLIMGCKAWHLADPKVNNFQRAYWAIVSDLAEGANLLVTIGEIDCRMDEGMFPRHKKTGGSLDHIIESTARGFVNFIATLAADKGHQANICGVPAPHPALISDSPLPEADHGAYLDMIRRFNISVEGFAKQRGCGFVDLYSMTVREAGTADGSHHIDRNHLYPSAIHRALGKA